MSVGLWKGCQGKARANNTWECWHLSSGSSRWTFAISELGSGDGPESEQGTNVGPLSWLARPEPQCLWGCGSAAKARRGPATPGSAGTFHVGAVAGRLQFRSSDFGSAESEQDTNVGTLIWLVRLEAQCL